MCICDHWLAGTPNCVQVSTIYSFIGVEVLDLKVVPPPTSFQHDSANIMLDSQYSVAWFKGLKLTLTNLVFCIVEQNRFRVYACFTNSNLQLFKTIMNGI